MKLLTVKLVTLGNLKYPVDFQRIEQWQSKIFQTSHSEQVQALPNAKGDNWVYTDAQLITLVHADPSVDFTLTIINVPLELNWYMRRLGNNVAVLSLHETADILRSSNLRIEQFILRNLYELCAFYLESGHAIPDGAHTLAHDETRNCLFDMNANKADIAFSTSRPILCFQCKARMMQAQVDKDFIPLLEQELKRIKKDLYYRIADWVKTYPIWTLLLTLGSSLLLNIAANFIYDIWFKNIF